MLQSNKCLLLTVITDVTLIIAFSFVYGACPLVMTWIPNVIAFPAEKRAVAIAFVNSLGNSASIYGVFLWPSQDAPRYIPGFTATTVWVRIQCSGSIASAEFLRFQMFALGCLALLMSYLVHKYPVEAPDPEAIVAQEIEKQRAKGRLTANVKGTATV